MRLDLRDLEGVRLLGEYVASERCLMIYMHPASRLRAASAWALLPLGLPVGETLKRVAKLAEEPEAKRYYDVNIEALQARRDIALAEWRAHTEKTTHVHH